MTINALFDPGIFFISDERWTCDESRNEFLDRLDRHLEFIDYIGLGKILWADEFDERLWSAPHLSPWKETRAWSIRLTQILYFKLSKHCVRLNVANQGPGESNPLVQFNCMYTQELFHRLVSSTLSNSITPYFCPSIQNISANDQMFRKCQSSPWKQFPVVKNPADWPTTIQPTDFFWPSSRNNVEKFKKCINLTAMSKRIDPSQLFPYELTPSFINDIITASRKERVVEMIVLRLTLTLQQATRDQQLQDEALSNGVRRFRVTPRPSSLRIHYKFNNNVIAFTAFYDEGHHDDGL